MSDPTALPPSVLAQILTPQATGQSQAIVPQPNAQIVELPPELQNVSLTQVVTAEVVRQSSEGVLTLKSDQGEITLQTALTFEPRDTVLVRIQNEAVFIQALPDVSEIVPTQPQLSSAQVPALSISQLLETSQLYVTPVSHSDLPNLFQPFVQVTEGQPNAINVHPLVPSQFETASSPPARTPLLVVPQSDHDVIAEFRVSLPYIQTEVPLRSVAAQLPLTAPVTADLAPSKDIAPLQISVTDVRNNVSALQQTQASLLSAQRAGEIRATLIGFTPEQHFPVFQTASQTPQLFALRAPIEGVPVGTEITLTVSQTQNVLPLNVSLPVPPLASWSSLNEVHETLVQQATPQVLQSFQASIPAINSPMQISNAVLFFLVAVRSGDVQGWLGDKAVDALKRAGKGDLINRIASEFSALNRADSGAGDWRVMALPLGWNDQIHKVTVSYRKEERDSDGRQTGTQTRFVMDFSLSAMGKVQLDALFSSVSKRLDLVVRTEGEFSQAARQHMRHVYKGALDETQITGELSFSGAAEGWVRVDESVEPEFTEEI